jgi:hypothetical protein
MKNTQITCFVEFLYKSVSRVSKLESETLVHHYQKYKNMDLGPCSFLCWVFGQKKDIWVVGFCGTLYVA